MPFSTPFFGWEGSSTKIDYRKRGIFILTSLLEDLVKGEGGIHRRRGVRRGFGGLRKGGRGLEGPIPRLALGASP